jgi:hypothetical protein
MGRAWLDTAPLAAKVRSSSCQVADAASTLMTMPVTIELPADAHARLDAEAARRGITLDELIAQLAEHLPVQPTETPQRKLAFLAAGASKAGISDQIDELLQDGFGRD